MNEPTIFGEGLRRPRTERGLSVRGLAELAHHSGKSVKAAARTIARP